MSFAVPSFKLYTGKLVPAVAYGTGTAWSHHDGQVDRSLVDSIKAAIKMGFRHLDTAESYGTERDLGVAIKESGIPREELFITHKVSRDHSRKDVPGMLRKALQQMGLEHVDLFLLHSPFFDAPPLQEVWAGLEAVHADGLATHIGVSNFNVQQLRSLLEFAKIKPAMNQVEYNPYCVDNELLSFSAQHGILQSAYSPLAPLTRFSGGALDTPLNAIAQAKGVTPAQVLLKWVLNNNVVAVTTTSNEERLKNFVELGFDLTEEEMATLTKEGAKEHRRIYWRKQYGEAQ